MVLIQGKNKKWVKQGLIVEVLSNRQHRVIRVGATHSSKPSIYSPLSSYHSSPSFTNIINHTSTRIHTLLLY